MKPPVLVITGGTGTGKSTVAQWLRERGAFVIDADRVGHELLLEPEVAAAVSARFGADTVRDGVVDRSVLGPRVFASAGALSDLESIVHPRLLAELARRVERARQSRAPRLIVVDAALHFRFDPALACDAVLMTTAPAGVRRARIMARDGIGEDAARDRLARQSDIDAAAPRADLRIDTTGSPDAVRIEVLRAVDGLFGLGLVESDPPPVDRVEPSIQEHEDGHEPNA